MQKNNEFAARLREIRKARRLKQSELAERTGLQPSAISQFETGQREPSPANLRKLASALNTSTDFLLTGHQAVNVTGSQIQAVIGHSQAMSTEDLDMLEDFAALLANKAQERKKDGEK